MLFSSPSSAVNVAPLPPLPPITTDAFAPLPPPNATSFQLALALNAPLAAQVLPVEEA